MSLSASLNKLNHKKIALLGLGLDNQALLRLLDQTGSKASITICDFRNQDKLPRIKTKRLKINYQLGSSFNQDLYKFDLLFRSPGWPLSCPGVREALKKGQTKVTSPLNLFMAICPTKNIIGVTGTKGKGTTASLIYKILEKSGKKVWLGGNIGISPLSFISKIKERDYVVLELSSFQLEDLDCSPRIAVITNLFKEHLAPADPNNPNFHPSYDHYWQAKLNITKHKPNRYLIANQALARKIKTAQLRKKVIYFKANPLPSKLVGTFNQENIGAAVAVAELLKIKEASYKKTVANFANLEHRLESVATKDGVKYFDNSFSTTPESTILDLKSFSEPLILIAGGADKGADFWPLAKMIKSKVKFLVLLSGQATPRLKADLKNIKYPAARYQEVSSMAEAVRLAKEYSERGDVILLSTACASFGLFKNYKERGDLFQKYARAKR